MVNDEHREPQQAAREVEKHEPFPDDGVTYCGWHTGNGVVVDGCGEVWPCSTVRRQDTRQERAIRRFVVVACRAGWKMWVVLVVLAGVVIVGATATTNHQKQACEQRGGHIGPRSLCLTPDGRVT